MTPNHTQTLSIAPIYDPSASYDATPYPRMVHRTTHPMHLAALAKLMGMEPALPSRCRLIDIGCASGTNVVPMAFCYPESEFMGIDASEQQIASGLGDMLQLGVNNLRLEVVDLMTLDDAGLAALGSFDYVVAHGFYSWVPPEVAERLVAIVKRLLAPQGVGFISYNVYPGWYMMEGLRNMMLYRVREVSDPAERIRLGRELLKFVAHTNPPNSSPFGEWVNGFQTYMTLSDEYGAEERNAYMLHDQLEAHNHPIFFHEFAAKIREYGLQYLCDAEISLDFPQGLPEGTLDYLRTMVHSPDEMQQYLDFARNRMFRRTLVTHDNVHLSRLLRPDRLTGMHFASPMLPVDESEIAGIKPVTFKNQHGVQVNTDHPLSKSALQTLVKGWPRFFTLQELVEEASARLDAPAEEHDVNGLCVTLMQAFTSGDNLVYVRCEPPAYAVAPSERPVSSRVARLDLVHGLNVTNLRHERVRLDPLEAELLILLDGSHTLADLVGFFTPAARDGTIVFADTDATSLDDEGLAALLNDAIGKRLVTLANAALLEA